MNKYEKLKTEQDKKKRLKNTDRFLRVVCFLEQKKLLIVPNMTKEFPKEKIKIKDVLWAAEIEPRILEVFPAAFIHFRKKFVGEKDIPYELKVIIEKIKGNEPVAGDFNGVMIKEMARWANIKLNDKRTVPVKKQKRQMNFRLSPGVNPRSDCKN